MYQTLIVFQISDTLVVHQDFDVLILFRKCPEILAMALVRVVTDSILSQDLDTLMERDDDMLKKEGNTEIDNKALEDGQAAVKTPSEKREWLQKIWTEQKDNPAIFWSRFSMLVAHILMVTIWNRKLNFSD